MNILLVDDNDFSLSLTEELIQDVKGEDGAEFVIAKNGNEAVSIFSESDEGTFDAIFMDIVMPELSGVGAAKKIRALQREDATTIPIIIVSALASSNGLSEDEKTLFNGYIQKPLSVDKIRDALCDL